MNVDDRLGRRSTDRLGEWAFTDDGSWASPTASKLAQASERLHATDRATSQPVSPLVWIVGSSYFCTFFSFATWLWCGCWVRAQEALVLQSQGNWSRKGRRPTCWGFAEAHWVEAHSQFPEVGAREVEDQAVRAWTAFWAKQGGSYSPRRPQTSPTVSSMTLMWVIVLHPIP